MPVSNLKQSVSSVVGDPATSVVLDLAETGFNAFSSVDDGIVQEFWAFEGSDFQLCRGVYTHSGTTLAITQILQKWVSGVRTDLPTGLTLTTAAIILIGTNGLNLFRKGRDLSASDASTTAQMPDNVTSMATSSSFLNANRMHLAPAVFLSPVIITNMIMEVTTAVTTSNVRQGIYSSGEGGLPVALLRETGDISAAVATTGTKTNALTAPLLLDAGVYWFANVTDSGTLKHLTVLNETDCLFSPVGIDSAGAAPKFYESGVTGALPAAIGTLTPDTLYKTSMGYS